MSKTDAEPSTRDGLGCMAGTLSDSHEIAGGNARLYHKIRSDRTLGQVRTFAADRGHLIGISLADNHVRNEIRGRSSHKTVYNKGSIYLRDFRNDFKADIDSFEFLLIECSKDALKRVAVDCGMGPVADINTVAGIADATLYHLGLALLQCFANQSGYNQILLDQLAVAAQTHVAGRYLCRYHNEQTRKRLLSRRQESIAKEMLSSNLSGRTSLASIAGACGLSQGYFIRAFRGTVGQTPHKWLTQIRIDRARVLLERSQKPIAEIAGECGFADQSHLTRVFTDSTGSAPGAWRRNLI